MDTGVTGALKQTIHDVLIAVPDGATLREAAFSLLVAQVRPQTRAMVQQALGSETATNNLQALAAKRLAEAGVPHPAPVAGWLIVAAQPEQPCPPATALRTVLGLLG